MSSPFKIFRKHQKQMLVVVFVMAMLAFVVGDPLMKMFGGRSREGGEAAAAPVVTIGKGDIKLTRREVVELRMRRRIANEFIRQAMLQSRTPLNRQLGFAIVNEQFKFMDQDPERVSDADVLRGYLLRKEGERLGVIISDDTINKFIENITRGNLSKRKFNNILASFQQNPPLSAQKLYDILRDEMLARVTWAQMTPTVIPAPEKYWDFHKRLHESQKVEAIVIPVEDFASKIKDPGDAELSKYFEEHKKRPDFDNDTDEFPVSFFQPDRLRVQHLRRKFSDVEASVAKSQPVTDKDISEYYEKNKDDFYQQGSTPEIGPPSSTPADPTKPLNPLITPGNSGLPRLDPLLPIDPGPASTPIPGQEKTGSEKKGPDLKGPAGKTPEVKATTPSSPEPKVPADPKGADKSSSDKSEPKKVEKPEPKKPDDKKPDDKGKKTSDFQPPARRQIRASRHARTLLTAFGGNQAETKEAPAKTDSKPAGKPADKTVEKAADKPPVKPTEKVVEKPAEKPATKPAAQPPAAGKEPATPTLPAKSDPATKPVPADAKATPPAANPADPKAAPKAGGAEDLPAAPAKAPPEKKYRPLDTKLKDEIRQNILRDRAFDEMQKQSDQVLADLRRAYARLDEKFQLLRFRDKDRTGLVAAAEAEMKKLAEKYKMDFGMTPALDKPMLDKKEFQEVVGLGRASEMSSNMMQRATPLADKLFNSDETFTPGDAIDMLTSDRYFYWKVDFKPQGVPEFTDAGVRAQVLKAWQMKQAAPLAEKRAQELVAILTKSTKPAEETLGKTTVTGDPSAKQVTVLDISPFTWLYVPSAHTGMPGQMQPVLWQPIAQLDKAGREFRELVYYQLSPGQWKSAPAFDKSAYYVVKLLSRHEPKKEELMQSALFPAPDPNSFSGISPYEQLALGDTQELVSQFFKQLEKKYNVKWSEPEKGDDHSAPPDEPGDG